MPYSYLLHGFGVFLGVIAGVAVTLIVQWCTRLKQESQIVDNLKFELHLNVKKIDVFLGYVNNYRNKTNAGSLDEFFDYFDLSRTIWTTTSLMFRSGLLYRCLKYDDIEKLQVMMGQFSWAWEGIINRQVTENRLKFDKRKTSKDIDFWENKFKQHKESLKDIAERAKPPQRHRLFKCR